MATFIKACSRAVRSVLVVATLIAPATATAQNPTLNPSVEASALTAGFHAERNYFSPEPWEHFDPMTSNIILTFTDLTLPGNAGRALRFQRTYNNKLSALRHPDANPNPNSRWTFGLAGVVMRVVEYSGSYYQEYEDNLNLLVAHSPKLVMADGSVRNTLFMKRPTSEATRRWAISGDLMRYDKDLNELWMPDGTWCKYDGNGWLTTIRDPFGNVVSLDRSTAGRLVVGQYLGTAEERTVILDLDDAGRPWRMSYLGREWTYNYTTQQDGTRDIETVSMPENVNWAFTYETAAVANNQDATIRLHTVTTPTLGQVTYNWILKPVYDPEHLDQFVDEWFLNDRTTSGGPPGTTHGTWTIDYPAEEFRRGYSQSTSIAMPSGETVVFDYGPFPFYGANEHLAMAGGAGLISRTIRANNVTIETESFQYTNVKTVNWTDGTPHWWGTGKLRRRTVTRPDVSGAQYTTTFTYDSTFPSQYHRPTRIVEQGELARTTDFSYDSYDTKDGQENQTAYVVGLLHFQAITVGNEQFGTTWDHDSATGAITRVQRGGLETIFTYTPQSFGNAATVRGPSGQTTLYTYSYGQPQTIETPKYTITREINLDGTIASETRGNRTTLYEYDNLMRPTKVTPPGGSSFTQTTYESPTSVLVERGNSWTRTTLDGFGRPIETINSVGVRTSTRYDAEGRVTQEGYPYTVANIWTQIDYDPLGRVRRRTNPDGTYKEWQYLGGGAVNVRDEKNRTTMQQWSAFSHPDDARLIRLTDAKNQLWQYEYNGLGSLTKVIAPDGKLRQWTYDSSNRLTSETHPESGTTEYLGYVGHNVTLKTDARGTTFGYGYDANDRPETITAGSGNTTTITYEAGSDQRASVSGPNRSTTFIYDAAGRVQERKDAIGSAVFSSRFVYDANGNLRQITYPSGRDVQYEYDSDNRVTRVFEPITPPRDYATGMTYHPSGALQSYTAGNGIQTTLTYDPLRYWIRNISAGSMQFSYDNYDQAGNVHTITDSRPGGMTQQFTYDELNRLKTVVGPLSEEFEYDVHGNRADANGATYTYELGTLRLASRSGISYTYDANGNLKIAGPNTFTYTPENWLATATLPGFTRTYAYDSDGWRSKRTTPGDTIFYTRGLANEVLTEWHSTSTGIRARDYVYAAGRLISAVERSATLPSGCGGAAKPNGAPVPLTIPSGGGSASVRFEGSECRRVSVKVTVPSGILCSTTIQIRRVDTNAPIGSTGMCSSLAFIEPVILPVSGDYDVVVTAAGAASPTVQIYDVVDVETPIIANGISLPVELLTPGQNARLPFTGSNGQRVSVLVNVTSGSFGCSWSIQIRTDTDAAVGSPQSMCGQSSGFLEPVALPANGNYVVVVDPAKSSTGTATVELHTVVDFTGTIATDGSPISVSIPTPGQNARFTFTGSNGQRVSAYAVKTLGNLGCSWKVQILKPDNTLLGEQPSCSGTSVFLEPLTLQSADTYTLVVNPANQGTGTVTVRLWDVPSDGTGSLDINGTPVSVSISAAGQNSELTFSSIASQTVTVRATNNAISGGSPPRIYLVRPDGSVQAWYGQPAPSSFNLPAQSISTGTYKVRIDPPDNSTGTISVQVTNP